MMQKCNFMEIYELKGLIKQPTCYQNPVELLCIVDLILSNVPRMFQSTYMIEIGLSDFHLITVTV